MAKNNPDTFYCVRDNMTGFMPDSDNSYYTNKRDAEKDAVSRVADYRDRGYTCVGSARSGFYVCNTKRKHDGPQCVVVIDMVDRGIYEDAQRYQN